MKLHYYPETDSLYIELKSTPGAEAREIVAGLVVDLDANGEVVGFDIDHGSACSTSSGIRSRRRIKWLEAMTNGCLCQSVLETDCSSRVLRPGVLSQTSLSPS